MARDRSQIMAWSYGSFLFLVLQIGDGQKCVPKSILVDGSFTGDTILSPTPVPLSTEKGKSAFDASGLARGGTKLRVPAVGNAETTVVVEWFRFSPNIEQISATADVIISHAGAGSVLSALRQEKRLIVLVNERLMDNHQLELAQGLEDGGFLTIASEASLHEVLRDVVQNKKFSVYPKPDKSKFYALIEEETGVHPLYL